MSRNITFLFSRAAITLLVLLITASTAWAQGIVASGNCGASGHESDVTWELTGTEGNYTLTISKVGTTGAMANYESFYSDQPWRSYRDYIKTIVINDGVTSIGSYNFCGCDATSVTIPQSVTAIGREAFYYCIYLSTCVIPNNVKTIGSFAFEDCRSLTTVSIPSGVTSVGTDIFRGTAWYDAQPNGLLYLDNWLVGHKGTLSENYLSIKDGTKGIAESALGGCSSTTIVITSSVTIVGRCAFAFCPNVAHVICSATPSGLTWDTASDDSTFPFMDYKETQFHVTDLSEWSSLSQEINATFVGDLTFSSGNCGTANHESEVKWAVYSYTIPDVSSDPNNPETLPMTDFVITGTGAMADYGSKAARPWNSASSNVQKLHIEPGLTHVGDYAFAQFNMTSVSFPSSVSSIGKYAFNSCIKLRTITIPASVTNIGTDAFLSCANTTDVYCDADPANLTWTDYGCDDFKSGKKTNCHVPKDKYYAYMEKWNNGSMTDINVTFVSDFDFTLSDNAANSSTIATHTGDGWCVKLNGRKFVMDGSWNTLCLPFALGNATAADGHHFDYTPLEGCVVKELDATTSNLTDGTLTLNFTDVTSIEAGKPYIFKMEPTLIINSDADWETFATAVSNGKTYAGKLVRLAANINVSMMANGTFMGILEGNGHTIFANLSGSGDGTALFNTIENATIQNLTVEGIITTDYHRPATFAAFSGGNSTIRNCWSKADISSTLADDTWVDAGAFVARVNSETTLNITDCAFTGSVSYTANKEGGGMVGWTQDHANAKLTNCLFAPSAITISNTEDHSYVFVSGKKRGTLTKCYYNSIAKESKLYNEGTDGSEMSKDALAEALGSNWQVVGNDVVPKMNATIDITINNPTFVNVTVDAAAPTPIVFNGGKFVGSYDPYNVTNDNEIIFVGSHNKIGYAAAGKELRPFRAHFDMSGNGGAPVMDIVLNFGSENTTEIVEAEANSHLSPLTSHLSEWYTLDGRKLNGKPTAKGVYIFGNKQVVIK